MVLERIKVRARMISGLCIGAALLAAAFWMPAYGLLAILLLICVLGTSEYFSILDAAGIPHFRVIGTLGGVAMVAVTWAALRYHGPGMGLEWEGVVLVAVTVAVLLRLFPQKNNPRPIETMASTILGVMYVPFLFNFFTKTLMGWDGTEGRRLVMYGIVVVKVADIGAYFVGCSVGRHKLFPRISPAKTWEGFFGGLAAGLAASLLFCAMFKGDLTVVRLSWMHAVILGLYLPLCGIVGDLSESMLKRTAGLKDSGNLILGMGGILDVIDSLLFAAPALYIYARLFLERMGV